MTERKSKLSRVIESLRERVDKNIIVDIRKGTAERYGVSETTFRRALDYVSSFYGFNQYYIPLQSKDDPEKTLSMKVLTPSDVTYDQAYETLKEASEKNNKLTPKQLQAQRDRELQANKVRQLKGKGMSNVAIGKEMGVSETTVRRLLKVAPGPEETLAQDIVGIIDKARADILQSITDLPSFRRLFGGKFTPEFYISISGVKMDGTVTRVQKTNELKFGVGLSFEGTQIKDNR